MPTRERIVHSTDEKRQELLQKSSKLIFDCIELNKMDPEIAIYSLFIVFFALAKSAGAKKEQFIEAIEAYYKEEK